MRLRPLRDGDPEDLLALMDGNAGDMAPWTLPALRRALTDEAREHGANVVIAERAERLVGGAGWVSRDRRFVIAPLLAVDGDVAATLVDACTATARGAVSIRVSTTLRSSPVVDALVARGFTFRSEVVDLARATVDHAAATGWISMAAVDRDRLLALDHETFRDVPNAVATTPAELDEALAGCHAEASGVLAIAGDYAGFVIALPGAGHLEISTIGVADAYRRRGLGRVLVMHAVGAAHRAGFAEIRAMVSSLNDASMALHVGLGFAPKYRRYVWLRDL
jgi:ribosomal protein S18 acetylase RimI-like enzyme